MKGRTLKLWMILALALWWTAPPTRAAVGLGDVTPLVTSLPDSARLVATTGTVVKGTVSIALSNLTASLGGVSPSVLQNYSTNRNLLPSIFTNVVYLNATGATAIINGTLLTNAMKTLPQFSMLHVGPGNYWNPTGTIPSMVAAADNRVIYFSPGAKWIVGNANGDGAYMVDDIGGKVTNVVVAGYGTLISTNDISTADLFYTEAGSNIRIECDNALMYGGGSLYSWGGGVSNNVRLLVRDTAVAGYDLIYGNGSDGTTLDAEIGYAEANGDMLETTDDSPQWGLIYVHIKRAKSRSVAQPSAAILSGRATLQVDDWEIARPAAFYSLSTTTNGLLIGGNWRWTGAITGGVVHPLVGSSTTALKIKNANITWPGNFDPFYLTNGTGTEFCLENVSLTIGSGPTNLARGLTPSRMRIIGSLAVNRSLGLGPNITLTGTNVMNSLTVLGAQTNAGTLNVAGAMKVDSQFTGSGVKVTGILDVDADLYAGGAIFTNFLIVPYQPASQGIEGEWVYDIDHWTAGRGTFLSFDGTEDIALLGVVSSDTPEIGDSPRYTAAGVTTWEPPNSYPVSQISGVGGANTNFTIVLPAPESVINGFTNVSVRAVMNTDTTKAHYWSLLLTNGGGSDRTLEFSAVTNRWRFSGTYGTNAPNTITNATQLLISGRSLGTNTIVGYTYFPWP